MTVNQVTRCLFIVGITFLMFLITFSKTEGIWSWIAIALADAILLGTVIYVWIRTSEAERSFPSTVRSRIQAGLARGREDRRQ